MAKQKTRIEKDGRWEKQKGNEGMPWHLEKMILVSPQQRAVGGKLMFCQIYAQNNNMQEFHLDFYLKE